MDDTITNFSGFEFTIDLKRPPSIPPGARLGRSFFEWCSKPEFGLVEVMGLFPKNRDLKSKLSFLCEFACPKCGELRWESIGRGKLQILISHLKFPKHSCSELVCEGCKAKDRAEREKIDPDEARRAAWSKFFGREGNE